MIRNQSQPDTNIVVLGVYWFLLLIAVVFAGFALREVNRLRTRRPVQVRVANRAVRLEVRELSGKRGKYKALFAVAALQLERLDTGQKLTLDDDALLTQDNLVSHAFLDAWEPGAILPAALQDGAIELHPPPLWLPAAAFGIGMLLFGTFAAIARPFVHDDVRPAFGWKIALLALFPIGTAVFGIGSNILRDKAEQALQRVPVEGFSRSQPLDEFLAELSPLGVTVTPAVATFLNTSTVRFCEFYFDGKKRRAASVWCQPPEGVACPGRLNPANPRDVKWDKEP